MRNSSIEATLAEGSRLPESPPAVLVRAGTATISGELDEGFAAALAAIPGRSTDAPDAAWSRRLGPDRAHSLAVAIKFHDVAIDPASAAELEELCARRGGTPVIELSAVRGPALSLVDDRRSPGLEELRTIPGARRLAAVDRTEIPLTRWSAEAVSGAVRDHYLRLSPAAEVALRELLAGAGSVRSASAKICLEGEFVVMLPGEDRRARNAFAAIPGVRGVGRDGRRWVGRANVALAHALRRLLATHADVRLDDDAARWLDRAPTWVARITIEQRGAAPVLRLNTSAGEPPEELRALEASRGDPSHRAVALTPANVSALVGLRSADRDVSLSVAAERCFDWVLANPEAKEIPRATLVVIEARAGDWLDVDPIWDGAPGDAFAQEERHLIERREDARLSEGHMPARSWPPSVLARFIRQWGVALDERARVLVAGVISTDADAERLLAMSSAEDAELEVAGLGGELMAFQRAGVIYALERRRIFVADEQGLGKTIQALATVQADLAYPAVVLCPASLKLNWMREIGKWLPEREVRMVVGRAPQSLAGAELLILNYEIVGDHIDELAALAPRALVLDESHYLKSPRAARTAAVRELSERLAPDALRLALTGTPVVNRPSELASQLRILGRLEEYGSARSFQSGFRSEESRRSLHARLRGSCYLRRRKTDVLEQLPDKRRALVTVPLSNEAEYRRAERDFVAWLREEIEASGEGQISQSLRAAALVRLGALRQLAARGKLAAALEWIEDFEETEERLVVFAHHREIQDAVVERFPSSARILGSDPQAERDRNVALFQSEDGPGICVCSLEAASHGFTLTAAANVAFLELAWTPAKHDQAEDRLHRIGQERGVMAWYLLAAKTIDERMAALLAEKREVVDSLTDGGAGGEGLSLAGELIEGYAATKGDGLVDAALDAAA
ncbi:MAG: DEAD/DEAH box helicase [Thermoleophilaceae bacterium]|nr:DEAD/DEAH box helicase [Thermoleophilaceae bacterium]